MSDAGLEALVRGLADSLGGERGSRADPDGVEVIHTHISVVFLTSDRAYKIKKPRNLGFLDFTTLERRRHYCHEEVRLNRRLAPHVYQGVVAVVDEGDGPRFSEKVWPDPAAASSEEPGTEGVGPSADAIVEWAVRMVRLPEERTLRRLLRAEEVGREELERLAERLARFHAEAEGGEEVSDGGRWANIRGNDRENFDQIEPFVGRTLSSAVFERLRARSLEVLEDLRPLIERRADENVPRDTHGDLRLGHIYFLPPGSPGTVPATEEHGATLGGEDAVAEIVAIDCVEFNERFRWADPVSDIAFPVMELEYEGRRPLARGFADRYFQVSGDEGGRGLLPYYTTYRDIVRGKVRSLEADDDEVPSEVRERAASKARRHFLRALDRLEPPSSRPALVIAYGLPGVGKSTLARALAEGYGFEWIDTDRVRKELFADSGDGAPDGAFETGLYTPDRTRRTYEHCLERARGLLFDGRRVVIEGTFREDGNRCAALEMARPLGVRTVFLQCVIPSEEAQRRISERRAGPSDADWAVHAEMAERWEDASAEVAEHRWTVPLEGDPSAGVERAVEALRAAGLAD